MLFYRWFVTDNYVEILNNAPCAATCFFVIILCNNSLVLHLYVLVQELKASEDKKEKKECRKSDGSEEESETGSLSDTEDDSSKTKLNGISTFYQLVTFCCLLL